MRLKYGDVELDVTEVRGWCHAPVFVADGSYRVAVRDEVRVFGVVRGASHDDEFVVRRELMTPGKPLALTTADGAAVIAVPSAKGVAVELARVAGGLLAVEFGATATTDLEKPAGGEPLAGGGADEPVVMG